MIDLKRILVPTDLSPCSVAATVQARQLAATFDAKIHVLFVLQDPVPMVAEPMSMAGLPNVIELRESMRRALKKWTGDHFGENSGAISVMARGKEVQQILRYVEDEHIDLIVMGTHGASGLEHALLGSVAERVVRRAPCPVLTVRPDAAADS